jgi:hypothetical protein
LVSSESIQQPWKGLSTPPDTEVTQRHGIGAM